MAQKKNTKIFEELQNFLKGKWYDACNKLKGESKSDDHVKTAQPERNQEDVQKNDE